MFRFSTMMKALGMILAMGGWGFHVEVRRLHRDQAPLFVPSQPLDGPMVSLGKAVPRFPISDGTTFQQVQDQFFDVNRPEVGNVDDDQRILQGHFQRVLQGHFLGVDHNGFRPQISTNPRLAFRAKVHQDRLQAMGRSPRPFTLFYKGYELAPATQILLSDGTPNPKALAVWPPEATVAIEPTPEGVIVFTVGLLEEAGLLRYDPD